jgi:hypothetical protein
MTVTRTQAWPGECSKKILVRIIPDNLKTRLTLEFTGRSRSRFDDDSDDSEDSGFGT